MTEGPSADTGQLYSPDELHVGQRVCVQDCTCYDRNEHRGMNGTVQEEAEDTKVYVTGISHEITAIRVRLDTWYRTICMTTVATLTNVPAPKYKKPNAKALRAERA
jgi:hypothetical protein